MGQCVNRLFAATYNANAHITCMLSGSQQILKTFQALKGDQSKLHQQHE